MRLYVTAAATTLVCLAAPNAAPAQTRAQVAMRFADMDDNKDRVISRKEWRGTEASFKVHDWNGDGVLSRAEVRVGAWRPTRGTAPADLDNPDITYAFADWTLAGFYRLDHDKNTRIDAAEWHFDREAFNRADHNHDGALSRAEFLGSADAAHDDDREDSFDNLDADRDGRLVRAEWHGGAARFASLDADRDGVLTRVEVTGNTEAMPDLFASIDVNRDGALTRDEWHWTRESFDARDPNNDGRITREEVTASGAATPAAQGQAHRDGYERGLADGRAAGQRDRSRGIDFNLDGRSELITADAGYQGEVATRSAYQAGYRDGFRRGYREAFPPQ